MEWQIYVVVLSLSLFICSGGGWGRGVPASDTQSLLKAQCLWCSWDKIMLNIKSCASDMQNLWSACWAISGTPFDFLNHKNVSDNSLLWYMMELYGSYEAWCLYSFQTKRVSATSGFFWEVEFLNSSTPNINHLKPGFVSACMLSELLTENVEKLPYLRVFNHQRLSQRSWAATISFCQ